MKGSHWRPTQGSLSAWAGFQGGIPYWDTNARVASSFDDFKRAGRLP